MPTYEYACRKCGEHLEVFQSFRDEPLKRHPGCGGRLEKVFGSVGIVLKGSGFYKTDNRSSAKAPRGGEHGVKEPAASGTGGGDDKGAGAGGTSNGSGSQSKNGASSGTGDRAGTAGPAPSKSAST